MESQTGLTKSKQTSQDRQATDRLTRLWGALGQMYGQGFYREFGEQPSMTWAHAVANLSDDEIRHGLGVLSRQNWTFPPNLGQFVAACKGEMDPKPEESDAPRYGQPPSLLPPPKTDRWGAILNRILLRKVMAARGVEDKTLDKLVAYKNHVASQMRQMWGDKRAPNDEYADIVKGVVKQFDEIIAADSQEQVA